MADAEKRMLRMRDMVQRVGFVVSGLWMACIVLSGRAMAEGALGMPREWEINFQPAYSPVMERIHEFHGLLMIIITAIVLLVLGIMGYIIVRFNARRNPVPSRTSHNTVLEVLWTAVPVLILVVIAIPSLKLLYYSNKAQNPDMTLKVVGHQWYWTYSYPDHGDLTFDSIPVASDALQPGQPRLLAVDNPVVLPVGAVVQVLVTTEDVLHNWAVPALGLKKDATAGRVNETWVQITQEGTFYGMCSELCGINHYFMPIEVRGVSKEAFDVWVEEAKQKFASNSRPRVDLAATAPATAQ